MSEFFRDLWRSKDAFARAIRGAAVSLGTAGLTKFPETRGEWVSFFALFFGGFIGVGEKNEPVAPVNVEKE